MDQSMCAFIIILACSIAVAQKIYTRMNPTCSDVEPILAASTSNHARPVAYSESITKSVENAVSYLLSQRHKDYSWGSSTATSRANVAMAFATRLSPNKIDQNEMKLMTKQLEIQLSLDLISTSPINLSHLALYVNAIYAMCEDPRNFQGVNLVHRLRIETTKVMGSNFSLPFVLLSLCISGENTNQDTHLLTKIYNSNKRLSTGAITVLAMACISRNNPNIFRHYINDFGRKISELKDGNLDAYTKALIVQAANAVHLPHSISLEKNQLMDGSFGDLLATYYAIPALLNSSLLDLKCFNSNEERARMSASYKAPIPVDKKVTLSLWIASDADYNTHSMVVSYKGNETLYEIMKTAESKDPMYRFLCDETKNGQEIFSLAGVPNDPEMGTSWKLYQARSDSVTINSKANMLEISAGINNILPRDKSHFLFWFDRS